MPVRGQRAEVPAYAFRFGFGGHVRLVPDAVERTGWILDQGFEDSQVILCRAALGDKFERQVVGRVGGENDTMHCTQPGDPAKAAAA